MSQGVPAVPQVLAVWQNGWSLGMWMSPVIVQQTVCAVSYSPDRGVVVAVVVDVSSLDPIEAISIFGKSHQYDEVA